jgi:hypothetical protein
LIASPLATSTPLVGETVVVEKRTPPKLPEPPEEITRPKKVHNIEKGTPPILPEPVDEMTPPKLPEHFLNAEVALKNTKAIPLILSSDEKFIIHTFGKDILALTSRRDSLRINSEPSPVTSCLSKRPAPTRNAFSLPRLAIEATIPERSSLDKPGIAGAYKYHLFPVQRSNMIKKLPRPVTPDPRPLTSMPLSPAAPDINSPSLRRTHSRVHKVTDG